MKLTILMLVLLPALFSGCESSSTTTAPANTTTQQAPTISKPAATPVANTASAKISSIKDLITVYKSPSCQCCSRWVSHLEANGFKVKAINVKDVIPYKKKGGVTPKLASCHTAFVNGYVVEGHVPASDIKRMLKEKPDIKGLTVPEMPVGTPGMEVGNKKDPYDVISFDKNGKTKVYKSYR